MKNKNHTKFIYSSIGIVLTIILWELLLRLGMVSSLLLPYPKEVAIELKGFATSNMFWLDLFNTILSWLSGLFIGVLIGVSIGLLLAINKKIWLVFEPLVEFFRSLPSIVLVPLISLFLGVGLESKITCVIVVVAVTIISTTGIAMRSINVTYLKLQHSWKLSLKNRLLYIYLPEISSHLVVAIKAAIPLALIVAVASDMLIATDHGIGKIITDSLAVFNIAKMYAAIIVVGILGYASANISSQIEKTVIHWKGR